MSPPSSVRMYRMAPYSLYDDLHLVLKVVDKPGADALDSRSTIIIHIPTIIYVCLWQNCDNVIERMRKVTDSQVLKYKISGSLYCNWRMENHED